MRVDGKCDREKWNVNMVTSKHSQRQIANDLDINPTVLSYLIDDKRLWRRDLYNRNMGVDNHFVNRWEC